MSLNYLINLEGEKKMQPMELQKGMVVQMSPECRNPAFACCFMVVDEPKSWGCQGYFQGFGTREEQGGQAYYRANWDEMELAGHAIWMVGNEEENTES